MPRAARGAPGARILWLLRHAKAVNDPPRGGSDADRVLSPRGRRDATALGRLLSGHGEGLGPGLDGVPRPALALVSPSARTAATAVPVLAEMAQPPEIRLVDELYGADPDEVLALLRDLPDELEAAMVVGHNPTAQTLSLELLAQADREARSLTVRHGFPTCALGVYAFGVTRWADVGPGAATLVALLGPPYG